MEYRDRIFKGATRPAMMLGIPIIPFILLVGSHLLLAIWAFVLVSGFISIGLGLLLVMEILILRQVNADDNHKLAQYFLLFREIGHRRNKNHWGAHSMSPVKLKKR